MFRCFKCWRYRHKAKNYRSTDVVCLLWNGKHKSSDYKASSHECTNYKYAHDVLKVSNLDFAHTVFDKECKSFLRALELAKLRINYSVDSAALV